MRTPDQDCDDKLGSYRNPVFDGPRPYQPKTEHLAPPVCPHSPHGLELNTENAGE